MGAIYVREVPAELQRRLRVEAARRGVSIRALVVEVLDGTLPAAPEAQGRKRP